MNPQTTTPNGVVKFATNIPEVISLAFAKGKEVSSQFGGDQVMYSLDDGRRMYLPPFVAQKIEAAGIGAHREFAIVKREVVQGNRRSVEYQIENLNDFGAEATGNVTAPKTNTPATHDSVGRSVDQHTNAAAADPETAAMINAHQRAIDVAAAAEAYASSKGLAIRYQAEDVRAIAATLFIQASKGGAR